MCKNNGNERVFDESKVLKTNAMLKVRPELFWEWDFEKNDELGLDVYSITKGINKKVWWDCPKCNSSYDLTPKQRCTDKQNCLYCARRRVNHTNSLASIRPDLAEEWHYEKNEMSPHEVTFKSPKFAWWICGLGHEYDATINKRQSGRGCPYCSGRRVSRTNSLEFLKPFVAKEWHPKKNKEKTPADVTASSNQKAFWICEKGHEWEAVISSRSNGHGCPFCCHNPRLLVGTNDMWTTNPELALLLINAEDGYKYTDGGDHKVDWECPGCNFIVRDKAISSVKHYGVPCPRCSDGVSYPEKLMTALLKELGIFFVYDNTTKWSSDKRYDFYLPFLNMIIEVHGKQHYEEGFECYGGRTLTEEQENDKYKHEMAIKNGIDKYIVIDARYSKLEFIKKSILESELNKLFIMNGIDWNLINLEAQKSRSVEILNLWKTGMNVKEISKAIKMSQASVYRILHNFEVKHFNI